jgi:two-component system chemotaxis response regulator CheB
MPGTVYFPPEDRHLEIDKRGRLVIADAPAIDGHRPSVTATFLSAASSYAASALGVLLTGMGSDGARGLQSIAQAGGTTIAQDEASCVVFGMPRQAIELGAAQHVLPPEAIGMTLLRLASGQPASNLPA